MNVKRRLSKCDESLVMISFENFSLVYLFSPFAASVPDFRRAENVGILMNLITRKKNLEANFGTGKTTSETLQYPLGLMNKARLIFL